MNDTIYTAQRVVVVGGGISGLAVASNLARAGVPVTLLEAASRLGLSTSTRNQGWLYSGAWFAVEQPELAKLCHEALTITCQVCPDCLDDREEGMAFVISRPDTKASDWTDAWTKAGIPFREIPPQTLLSRVSGLDPSFVQHAWMLPDRAFRPDVLLNCMAATASNAGAEIRIATPVKRLIREGDRIVQVVTGTGEPIAAQLVILAADVGGRELVSEYLADTPGWQPSYQMVAVKTHLMAVEPEVSSMPFCIVDRGGFNHVPHGRASVFGTNRWAAVADGHDQHVDPAEATRLCEEIRTLFPHLKLDGRQCTEWAGTMMQAMHVDQVEPGRVPKPTLIDHERESPRIANLLSLYPGRASLWPQLAEQATRLALDKLKTSPPISAVPPYVRPT